jgi:putative FmdB family regulatory protein
MPVFDFQCEKCGNEFEVERPLGAAGTVKCPSCGSTKTAKVFSAAGIVFKGSGFYVTDSKAGSSEKKADKSGTPIEKKTGTTDTGTSDSKPAKTEKPKSGAGKDSES